MSAQRSSTGRSSSRRPNSSSSKGAPPNASIDEAGVVKGKAQRARASSERASQQERKQEKQAQKQEQQEQQEQHEEEDEENEEGKQDEDVDEEEEAGVYDDGDDDDDGEDEDARTVVDATETRQEERPEPRSSAKSRATTSSSTSPRQSSSKRQSNSSNNNNRQSNSNNRQSNSSNRQSNSSNSQGQSSKEARSDPPARSEPTGKLNGEANFSTPTSSARPARSPTTTQRAPHATAAGPPAPARQSSNSNSNNSNINSHPPSSGSRSQAKTPERADEMQNPSSEANCYPTSSQTNYPTSSEANYPDRADERQRRESARSEWRLDPATNRPSSLEELERAYRGHWSNEEIEDYWRTQCQEVQIGYGTLLIAKEATVAFESTSSWTPLGSIAEGRFFVAAGRAERYEDWIMVPIRPRGFVDLLQVTVAEADVRVFVGDPGKGARGALKFFGKTEFADGFWCGVACDERVGRHNGCVGDVEYFQCGERQGLFVRPKKVRLEASMDLAVPLSGSGGEFGTPSTAAPTPTRNNLDSSFDSVDEVSRSRPNRETQRATSEAQAQVKLLEMEIEAERQVRARLEGHIEGQQKTLEEALDTLREQWFRERDTVAELRAELEEERRRRRALEEELRALRSGARGTSEEDAEGSDEGEEVGV